MIDLSVFISTQSVPLVSYCIYETPKKKKCNVHASQAHFQAFPNKQYNMQVTRIEAVQGKKVTLVT